MARYAVGDIQGCMTSFERLLAVIEFQPGRDDLWLVGDLVNRGPRSLDVLKWAKEHDSCVTVVLGNHDLHLLARAAGVAPEKKRDTLHDVLGSSEAGPLLAWLRRRSFFHLDGEHALVHAGLHPGWTVAMARSYAAELEDALRSAHYVELLTAAATAAAQPVRWDNSLTGPDRWRSLLSYFVRVRMLKNDGRVDPDFDGHPSTAPANTVAWFAYPDPAWHTHTITFGHWAALGLDLGARHQGLDTGCVWGRQLTALRLHDKQVFQVKAVEAAS